MGDNIRLLAVSLSFILFKGYFGQESPCEQGWVQSYAGFCYQINAATGTWHEADDRCRTSGAQLLSIHDESEKAFLIGKVQVMPAVGSKLWIGLHALGDDGTMQWTDGSFLNFLDWNDNPVENIKNNNWEKCYFMNKRDGTWGTEHCDGVSLGYICKKLQAGRMTEQTVVTTPAPSNCPPDWHTFGKKCFKILGNQTTSWQAAEAGCQAVSKTGHLATIHSKKEQVFLTSLLGESGFNVWIGFLPTKTGTYLWTDNYPNKFSNWNPTTTRTWGRDNCVELLAMPLRPAMWNIIGCDSKRASLCQMYKDPAYPIPAPIPQTNCPQGFLKYREDCYASFPEPKKWDTASAACMSLGNGSHLVSVSDSFEQAFLTSYFGEKGNFWIGFFITSVTNTRELFQWSDGWPTFFTNWREGQPMANSSDYLCTTLGNDGSWETSDCQEEKGYICKIPQKIPPKVETVNEDCPSGWLNVKSKYCYLVYSERRSNWEDASKACKLADRKAELASFHSLTELQLLIPRLDGGRYHHWIGLSRNKKRRFVWKDQSPSDFFNWAKGEPSNGYKEDCVEMYSHDLTWNDVTCSSQNGYICSAEKDN